MQSRYALGVERNLSGGDGRHSLGLNLVGLRGRDGAGNENQIMLSWRYALGVGASTSTGKSGGSPASVWHADLLDEVTLRPSFVPSQAVSKIDTMAAQRRLIVVDRTSLPAGATINAATGAVTAPIGVVVGSIASITRNGAAFTNSGQFALSGNSLVVNTSLMIEPAAGVQDTYVVTANNTGGGTTLITVKVSKGSVKIDSITVAAGAAADTTAPSKTSESLANLNAGGGTATGSITFDEAVAQVTSISFKKTSDNTAAGGMISVASGLNTTTLNVSWTAPSLNEDVYIQIVVKDAANNSRTINTNNYTLF